MRNLNDLERFGANRTESKNNVAIGLTLLFVGLGIGAAVALLYAPEAGRRTRRRLRRAYEDARETVGDWGQQAGQIWERGSGWASDARDRVADRVRPIGKAWR